MPITDPGIPPHGPREQPGSLPRKIRFEIAPRSIALVLATVAGVWLVWQLRLVELILIIALILAGTFNPVIGRMEKLGFRRTPALLLFLLVLVAGTAGVLVLTVPPLISQIMVMVRDAPAMRMRLIAMLSEHAITTPLAHTVETVDLQQMSGWAGRSLLGLSSNAVRLIGYGVTTLALSFYLLADGKRAQGVAYAMVPRSYHIRLARILQKMETIVGGYMRGQLITCAGIGIFTFALLSICRVPNALSLAIFASVVDVIPFIGGLMVIVPAVLSALPLGRPTAVAVGALLMLYMEFESRILVPRIYGDVLRLPRTAVVLALISGATLDGIVGALLALPIAAGLLMILEELRVELPGDDSVDETMRARYAETEAAYEELSAGASAPDAGEIAKTLAQEIIDEVPTES